ncbi:MAG: MurR/RpiR family transcriptional regulator [Butyricicoccus sp.]|nr:MurR/RpiR family transcriptional regulator [Butyricicoccus sp.]
MFTIERIQTFNELEMLVYQYVIQHQSAIPYMRIRELAAEAHVSSTTILRFCKKLGCDGYAEFKLKKKEQLGRKNDISIPEDLSELKAFLERIESAPFQKKLDEAASIIAKADRVLCVGISNSGYIAQYAARIFPPSENSAWP